MVVPNNALTHDKNFWSLR